MKTTSLKVDTPEGLSGRVLTSADDYIFRYQEEAMPAAAINLTMPKGWMNFVDGICTRYSR